MSAESLWKMAYKHLKDHGIDVYSPGQHQGECISPYVILKAGSTVRVGQYSSTQTLYNLFCYVPEANYSMMEPYLEQVKDVMTGIFPVLIPTYFQTEPFLDDTVKGHVVRVEYRASRKITRR